MSRLTAALGVRAGEERLAGWLTGLFAATQAGHGLGANTGDALLFVRFGVEHLPVMIVISGTTSMAVTLLYGLALGRMGVRRLMPAAALTLAIVLVSERALIMTGAGAVYPVIWLTEQAVILLTFTMMWNVAAEACDARQSKRLFPLLASAGIAGGVVGNFSTGPAAHLLGTENLLLVHAALLLAVAVVAAGATARFVRPVRSSRRSLLADLGSGWATTARSPFLRLAALSAVAFSMLFFLVVFPFAEQVTASFGSDADVAAFLGVFSGAATAATFLVSLLAANRLFAWIGVVGAVLIVPLAYLAGFALWALSFTLATAAAVRAAQWIAVNGIGGTAWSSLFNVVDAGRRGSVMAFITAVPMQLGVMASGAILLVWPGDVRRLAAIGIVLAAAAAALVWRMRLAYADALVDAVRRGLDVFAATSGLAGRAADAGAVRALAAAMDDPRAGVRRIAVATIGHIQAHGHRDRVIGALADRDPWVRCAAIAALGRLGGSPPPQLRRLLDDPVPAVRAAAAVGLRDDAAQSALAAMVRGDDEDAAEEALGALVAWPEAAAGLELSPLLSSPRPATRLLAAQALLGFGDRAGLDAALMLLEDADETVRLGASQLLAGRQGAQSRLLDLLADGAPETQEAAARALSGLPAAAAALADWAIRQIDRALELRGWRAQLGDGEGPASAAYLRRVLEQRQRACERRALAAIESLASRQTAHLLSRGVHAGDAQLRAQAVEALDALADRRLSRRLVPLLEADRAREVMPVPDGALQALLHDDDLWLRALADRCIADGFGAISARDGGGDAAARGSAAPRPRKGDAMEEIAGPGLIDRMMRLQQVPMFSGLEPEVLSRIAELCEPVAYAAGETIYRMGEAGDEMLVISEGLVVITVPSNDGARVLRTFGPGEHVGELAVLRGMPRMADVTAEEPVSGLVIRSADLRSILSGRPDVAMAMLATLAERLGTIV